MPNTLHQAGATSKIVTMRAWVASTGLPYTAGAFNTSGLSLTYTRDGATFVTITPVTATAGTYTSSGFVHAGKGEYEIGAPTAALAAGADGVRFKADGITDVVFEEIRVELTGTDPRSAAEPDVNVTKIAGTTQTAGDVVAMLGTIDDYLDTELAAVLAAVDTEIAAIKAKTDNLPTDPADASDIAASFTTVNTKLDTIDDFLDTEVAAIKAKTDNLPADPADASDILGAISTLEDFVDTEVASIKGVTDKLDTAMELDGAVYRFTTNALEQAPTGGSAPTAAAIRTEIDANSTQLAAIRAKTDNLPADPADASDIAGSLTTITGYIDTEVAATLAAVDTEVAAIKAKTDNLPSDPADASDIAASFTAVNTKLDTIDDLLDTEIPALTTAVADLPTNAELATALAAADDAVLAAIAALNNLDSAGAQAAAAAALAAYTAATAADVAAVPAAVLTAADAAPIAANVKEVNDVALTGTGVLGDEWGPV